MAEIMKRNVLTLEQRIRVVEKLEAGVSCRVLAKQFDCGKTQICRIKAEKEDIKCEWEAGARLDIKYFKRKKSTYEDLNNLVFEWFCDSRAKAVRLSGRMIQDKALQLSVEMGHDEFSASNGWLESWLRRHNICLSTLCGPSADVNQSVVNDWLSHLPDLLKDYAPEDIYNADEVDLFYRALPRDLMVVEGDDHSGVMTATERITALLACSSTGDKLRPWVIGESKKPLSLNGMDSSLLPVTYHANTKAEMTSELFGEWLMMLNTSMVIQHRKILLLLDSCAVHPALKLSNIELVFLPPKTTSRLQPCSAGIFTAVKANYRKRLLHYVLARMEKDSPATDVAKSITITDAMYWLHIVWESLPTSTITKCFNKCGIPVYDSPAPEADNNQSSDTATSTEGFDEVKPLLDDMSWEEYVSKGDNTAIKASPEDFGNHLTEQTFDERVAESKEQEDPEPLPRPTISSKVSLSYMDEVCQFAEQTQNSAIIEAANRLKTLLIDYSVSQASKIKQEYISDFEDNML